MHDAEISKLDNNILEFELISSSLALVVWLLC